MRAAIAASASALSGCAVSICQGTPMASNFLLGESVCLNRIDSLVKSAARERGTSYFVDGEFVDVFADNFGGDSANKLALKLLGVGVVTETNDADIGHDIAVKRERDIHPFGTAGRSVVTGL